MATDHLTDSEKTYREMKEKEEIERQEKLKREDGKDLGRRAEKVKRGEHLTQDDMEHLALFAGGGGGDLSWCKPPGKKWTEEEIKAVEERLKNVDTGIRDERLGGVVLDAFRGAIADLHEKKETQHHAEEEEKRFARLSTKLLKEGKDVRLPDGTTQEANDLGFLNNRAGTHLDEHQLQRMAEALKQQHEHGQSVDVKAAMQAFEKLEVENLAKKAQQHHELSHEEAAFLARSAGAKGNTAHQDIANSLTDDEIKKIQDKLQHLPPGASVEQVNAAVQQTLEEIDAGRMNHKGNEHSHFPPPVEHNDPLPPAKPPQGHGAGEHHQPENTITKNQLLFETLERMGERYGMKPPEEQKQGMSDKEYAAYLNEYKKDVRRHYMTSFLDKHTEFMSVPGAGLVLVNASGIDPNEQFQKEFEGERQKVLNERHNPKVVDNDYKAPPKKEEKQEYETPLNQPQILQALTGHEETTSRAGYTGGHGGNQVHADTCRGCAGHTHNGGNVERPQGLLREMGKAEHIDNATLVAALNTGGVAQERGAGRSA